MVHKPSNNNRKLVSLKQVYIDGVFCTYYVTIKTLLEGTQYKAIADAFDELVTVFGSLYPVRWIKANDFAAILAHE